MLGKLLQSLWSMRAQFIKYFITGVSAVILDMLTLFFIKEFLHLRPVLAVVANQVLMLNYVFFINKYWSFKSNGATSSQAIRFLMVALMNYSIAVAWMWFFNEQIGIHYLIARIVNIAVAVAWNFLLYRYFVYRAVPASVPVDNPIKERVG